MNPVPTVKVKHPDGYAIINESDFREGVHELFDAPTSQQADAPPAGLTEAQIKRLNKTELTAFLTEKGAEAPAEATNAALIELALPFAVKPE